MEAVIPTARPPSDADAYQVMPPLADADYAALKADIAERGVLVPVEIDEHGNTLDGHHRLRACEELGITDWPRLVRAGLTEVEKRQHARQLNIARRHLDRAQKRELIAAQLKDTPEKSNRQIAAGLGVDDKTVGSVRREAEATAEIPQLDKTIGADGKARHKPIRTTYVDTSQPAATLPAVLQSARASTALDGYLAGQADAGTAPTAAGLKQAIREAAQPPAKAATHKAPKVDPNYTAWGDLTSAVETIAEMDLPSLRMLAQVARRNELLAANNRHAHRAAKKLAKWIEALKKEIENG